jgi:hypothetical protein
MFTLYSADFIGNPGNCSYPHKTVVMDADSPESCGRSRLCVRGIQKPLPQQRQLSLSRLPARGL